MNLITAIDNYLLQEHEAKKRESYYPSEVSKCLRQLYYRWTNEKPSNPIEAGGIWKMRMGDAAHDMIHEFLEKAGFEIINEVSFKKDIGLKYPISGRIDNVFIDEDGTLSGIEVKSSYGAGIKNIQKSGHAKKDDIDQVTIYSGCTDIKRWYLIYFGRDNAYRTQFVIDNPQGFDELAFRFKLLEVAIELNTLPDREYLVAIKNGEIKDKFQKDNVEYKTSWRCNYCSYKDMCWQEVINNLTENDNSAMFKEAKYDE
jgi:CRISPR/Cas system-associated exonuclease Cas4 (RecB family)